MKVKAAVAAGKRARARVVRNKRAEELRAERQAERELVVEARKAKKIIVESDVLFRMISEAVRENEDHVTFYRGLKSVKLWDGVSPKRDNYGDDPYEIDGIDPGWDPDDPEDDPDDHTFVWLVDNKAVYRALKELRETNPDYEGIEVTYSSGYDYINSDEVKEHWDHVTVTWGFNPSRNY